MFRQRNLTKRKATLVPASLRCASGNLRCSVQSGSGATRLRLKQAPALIRLALRSSAHPQGFGVRGRAVELFVPLRALTQRPGVAPAGELLFFASPKNPHEKKGDPGSCVPTLALRATCGARSSRGLAHNSPAAQTSASPDPPGPALLSASSRALGERGREAEGRRPEAKLRCASASA